MTERFPLTCPHCGQTAMFLRNRVSRERDGLLWPSDVELPDGSRPQQGELIQCGACDAGLIDAEVIRMIQQAGALDE